MGGEKPSYCLNIGFTWNGLRVLGLPLSTLSLFPREFRNGPERNAKNMGDEGASAPDTWTMGGPATAQVHMVLSLFTNEARNRCMERWTIVLEGLFAASGIVAEWRIDATALHDGKVHFGYDDGIAQPRIKGVPRKQLPDMQPASEPGEFLLGRDYINQYGGNFIGGLPPQLADNATYGAFRVLEQDVAAFEKFLVMAGKRYNMSPELIAAKLMGRWRNGIPLTLSPDTPASARGIEPHQINNFDYAPSDEHPTYFDDRIGLRCPVGSHIRRLNPRSSLVMGMPYITTNHPPRHALRTHLRSGVARRRTARPRAGRLLHLRRPGNAVRVSSIDVGERRLFHHRDPGHTRTAARRSAGLRRSVRYAHERCA